MKKIFLDVGGHLGETLDAVLGADFRFDVVHCFEPQSACCEALAARFAPACERGRLVLHNFGLADVSGERTLFGMGVGASVFADKQDIDNNVRARCRFVRASSFFDDHIAEGDVVIMKLNCEGGEALILRDLIESGKVHLLSNVMIDFDVRKIPSQQHTRQQIMDGFRGAGFANYSLEKQFMIGVSHQNRIRWWLANLDNSPDFMNLGKWEKARRLLPMGIRRWLQKMWISRLIETMMVKRRRRRTEGRRV